VVVVCELGSVEEVCPIILLSIAEHADVGLAPLVIVFYLPLSLWVVCSGESLVDVQGFEKASGVLGCECGPSVRVVYLGDAVMLPHMFQV